MDALKLIILIAFVASTHAKELAINQIGHEQEKLGNQASSGHPEHSRNMLVNNLVNRLANQRLEASSLHNVDMEGTTLGKSGSLPMPSPKQTFHPTQVQLMAGSSSGACSLNDGTEMWALGAGTDDGSWPKVCSDCAHSALSIFTGIQQEEFNSCLTGQVSISTKCSTCFAQAAQYAYDECKFQCMQNSWSESCLNCAAGFDVQSCAGINAPQPVGPQAISPGNEDTQHIRKGHSSSMTHMEMQIFPQILFILAVALVGLFAGSRVSLKFAVLRFRAGSMNASDPPLLSSSVSRDKLMIV